MKFLPNISVVIPHLNDPRVLDCLDAVRTQAYPSSKVEIVIVDNGPRDGLVDLVRRVAGRATVLHQPIRGAGAARNLGILAARYHLIAMTDCDCLPGPFWLARGVEALQHYTIAGGRIDVVAHEPPTAEAAFDLVFGFDQRRYVEQVGFAATANLFVHADAARHIGGFLASVSEDVEWGQRAKALGYRIGYVDEAIVEHPARADWPGLSAKILRAETEAYALHRFRGWGRLAYALRAPAYLASAVVHVPRVLATPKLTSWRARRGALGVLFRSRAARALLALWLAAGSRP